MIYECLLLLSVQLSLVSAKYCNGTEWCAYGCCGDTYNLYCCKSYVGAIVSGIVGFVSLMVIIATCYRCCCYGTGQPTTVISTVYPPGFSQQPGFTPQPPAYPHTVALPHAGAYPQQPMSPGPYT